MAFTARTDLKILMRIELSGISLFGYIYQHSPLAILAELAIIASLVVILGELAWRLLAGLVWALMPPGAVVLELYSKKENNETRQG